MASQSFRNTIRIIEDALRSCPTLRKVVCTERPVRVDDMAELSLYSNSELRRLAVASEFASRIVVSSNMSELCTTEEEKVEVFRAPNSKGADGIHMRGVNGAEFFTETLIAAAKLASTSSRGLARGRQAASRLDGEQESRGTREPLPSSRLKRQRRQADPGLMMSMRQEWSEDPNLHQLWKASSRGCNQQPGLRLPPTTIHLSSTPTRPTRPSGWKVSRTGLNQQPGLRLHPTTSPLSTSQTRKWSSSLRPKKQ